MTQEWPHKCPICGTGLAQVFVCYECRLRLAREAALAKNTQEIEQEKQYLLEHKNKLNDSEVVQRLVSFYQALDEDFQQSIAQQNIFNEPLLYLAASESVSAVLWNNLKKNPRKVLSCLAFVQDQKVIDYFYFLEQSQQAPKFYQDLGFSASLIAQEAGWTIDLKSNNLSKQKTSDLQAKHKIALTYTPCIPLIGPKDFRFLQGLEKFKKHHAITSACKKKQSKQEPLEEAHSLCEEDLAIRFLQGNTLKDRSNEVELYQKSQTQFKANLDKAHEISQDCVQIYALRDDRCSCCNLPLVDIAKINFDHPRFKNFELKGKFVATMCVSCNLYEAAFSRYDEVLGTSELLASKMTISQDFLEQYGLSLEEEEVSALANQYFMPEPLDQNDYFGCFDYDLSNFIGGHPAWLQGADYLECPQCLQTMRFLMQIQWSTLEDLAEGSLYIQHCPICKIAGVIHQQT